ncbi:MAG: helix-turn-helix domain-containing protein [Ruminococcus sp.]|nr:helix-turn-helix domain-containing protein [Ruminococcus sp.]
MLKEKLSICEKAYLTLEEAAEYFNIGINKLREMTNDKNCPYVIWNGTKRLIKRKKLEAYLDGVFTI